MYTAQGVLARSLGGAEEELQVVVGLVPQGGDRVVERRLRFLVSGFANRLDGHLVRVRGVPVRGRR